MSSMDLIDKAIAAYHLALEVYTKENGPQDWAATETNLGDALFLRGEYTRGLWAMMRYAESAQAYQAALEVYTKGDSPREWAMTLTNLGNALRGQGELCQDQRSQLFTQSVLPYLSKTIRDAVKPCDRDQARELFAKAVQAHTAALEVYTKDNLPQDWAMTQNNLGKALLRQAGQSSGNRQMELATRSVQAYGAALEVYTKVNLPWHWERTQIDLGEVLYALGNYSGAAKAFDASLETNPTNTDILEETERIYHDKLYNFTRAFDLARQHITSKSDTESRLFLLESTLTTGNFGDCAQQAASIDGSWTLGLLVRDSVKMACLWGIGQQSAALTTAAALKSDELDMTSLERDYSRIAYPRWNTAGIRQFLGSSQDFRSGRELWIALFQSVEDVNATAFARALRQLQEVMSHYDGPEPI